MSAALYPVAILAGGLATRLHPVTESFPKALIPIKGVPFIDHQLRLLQQQGIREVVLCVGYKGEMIQDYVGAGERYHLHVQYSFDDILLGTGGAVKRALPLLKETFFVLYGDSYLPCDFVSVQSAFIQQQKAALMTVFKNQGEWDTSNVEFVDGKIIAYDKVHRMPTMQYIDYGLGIFTRQAFSFAPEQTNFDLAMLYQNLLKQNQLAAFEVRERFYEAGSFAGIAELEQLLS